MQLGLIGLGTMGTNLARNAARNGATVAVFNRTTEKTDAFMKAYGRDGAFVAATSLKELVVALKPPRPILLMVKAGEAADQMIAELVPLLDHGNIIIDAGNSHYSNTERREKALQENRIRFVGMGVSGGEEGALKGPSMMPGGDRTAYDALEPLLKKMAADDGDGGKCISYIGPGGSGHFVKMVHNGIEYGIMQLIAECYDILKSLGRLSNAQLSTTFSAWNRTPGLSSFLVEITADIFRAQDPETKNELIDVIKDAAEQMGTGKWTTQASCDLGQAAPTINAAVAARMLSGDPKRMIRKREKLPEELDESEVVPASAELCTHIAAALECSMICVYNQGFHLMERASEEHAWGIDLSEVARIWRGGCIIRSTLLKHFQHACSSDSLVAASAVKSEIVGRFSDGRQRSWRHVVRLASAHGIPVPAMAASLSYYDTLRRERLPQNLIQAQRDYFGAHTYERTDRAGSFHSDWKALSREL